MPNWVPGSLGLDLVSMVTYEQQPLNDPMVSSEKQLMTHDARTCKPVWLSGLPDSRTLAHTAVVLVA